MDLKAQGSGSVVDASNLVSFSIGSPNFVGGDSLTALEGGRLGVGNLITLDNLDLTVDGAVRLPTDKITSFTKGILDVSGGMPADSASSPRSTARISRSVVGRRCRSRSSPPTPV